MPPTASLKSGFQVARHHVYRWGAAEPTRVYVRPLQMPVVPTAARSYLADLVWAMEVYDLLSHVSLEDVAYWLLNWAVSSKPR